MFPGDWLSNAFSPLLSAFPSQYSLSVWRIGSMTRYADPPRLLDWAIPLHPQGTVPGLLLRSVISNCAFYKKLDVPLFYRNFRKKFILVWTRDIMCINLYTPHTYCFLIIEFKWYVYCCYRVLLRQKVIQLPRALVFESSLASPFLSLLAGYRPERQSETLQRVFRTCQAIWLVTEEGNLLKPKTI